MNIAPKRAWDNAPAAIAVDAAARRGAQDGENDVPAANAQAPGACERDILAASEALRGQAEARAASLAADALRRVRATAAPPDLASPIAEARVTLRQIEGRFAPDCAAALDRAGRARADLEGFRRANGLRRAAVYPTSTTFQAALLAMAALFESLFSATLFAQEAEQGLLGGAAIAVGLSGANVTLGYLAGFLGLRYLQHVKVAPRIAGGAALAACFGLGLALNWFAANWRQTMLGGERDLYAPHAFDLLGLTEPQAVILLMLGGGVWVFAALKGYSGFDDPYPDYGKMDRAARDADEAAAEAREDARDALEGAVEACRKQVASRLDVVRAQADKRAAAFDETAKAIADIAAQARAGAHHAERALRAYRDANRGARRSPPPAHFDDAPAFIDPAAPDPLRDLAAAMETAQAAETALLADAAAKLDSLAADMEAISLRLEGRPA